MQSRIQQATLLAALLLALGACGSTESNATTETTVIPVTQTGATETTAQPASTETPNGSTVPEVAPPASTTTIPLPRTTAEATPEDPVPPGEIIEFTGKWDLAVTDVEFDATEYVVNLNEINPDPDDGYQYVLIHLTGTYLGDRVAQPVFEWAVSDGTNSFTPSIPGCGVIADSIYDVEEVIPNESFQGSICVPILTTSVEAGDLELFLQLPDDDPKYFALE